MKSTDAALLRRVRWLTLAFMLGLLVSGLTAVPLQSEVDLMVQWFGVTDNSPGAGRWLRAVQLGLQETNARFPFMAYGTDWLAFGHVVIAIAFLGALHDPVRNEWLYTFGMIACVLVVPWALVFGAVRGIPMGWRLVDCSFGVVGFVPLWFCRRWVRTIERRV